MYDLISIGDVAIDTYIFLKDAQVLEKDGERFLAVRFGAKIPMGSSFSAVGGNAANNAVGSARLKLKTAIYTNVGNKDIDAADDRIKAQLKKEGVDIGYVLESWDLQSNHHIVLDYKGERTILTNHQSWKFKLPDLDRSRWVYLTSLSPSYVQSNIIEQIISYIDRTGARLAYQPGTFQIKQGIKKYTKLLSLSEIFFVNLEEAKTLLGYGVGRKVDVRKLLKGLLDHGPRKVIITDGVEGSYGYDGEGFYKLGIFPAKLLDMTGSGDGYATACAVGLFYGKELPEAMRWGAANGASVVEQIGPQAGLLTYSQMQEKLKENKKIVAKEI
jgi:sugar/nucleoside kinase (ribokinase family)